MKIDTATRRFVLANRTGGLSGPAIHPVAVRMVYEAANAVKIPIIGMGGVTDANSAIELMLAGASMVAVGTANFFDPQVTERIIDGMEEYARDNGLNNISEIVGAAE